MPPAKKINYKKLLKAIEDGKHQKDIMKDFEFKTLTQLKNAYATALMEEGKIPALVSGRGPAAADEVSDEIAVGARGSLIIPKKLAEKLGLKEGDKFKVRKSAAGMSLKKIVLPEELDEQTKNKPTKSKTTKRKTKAKK